MKKVVEEISERCDADADAHDWDGVPDPRDPMTVDEGLAALALHAAKAMKRGDYGAAEDLTQAGNLIERLSENSLPGAKP